MRSVTGFATSPTLDRRNRATKNRSWLVIESHEGGTYDGWPVALT